jgi:hypothetical protein
MPRKPALSEETLQPLGAARLARIILEEADANPNFRKRVNAALAGAKGPDAVAKPIDLRLAALEGERPMVANEKARQFRDSLRATVATVVKDLGPLSPAHAVERLLRFLDTYQSVIERIGESPRHIEAVYHDAAASVPDLVGKLDEAERALLPARLTAAMLRHPHGPIAGVAAAIAPLLPKAALAAWDKALAGAGRAGKADDATARVRQAIADARGDVDGLIAVQRQLAVHQRNPLAAAERLLAAGRLEEALAWARQQPDHTLDDDTRADMEEAGIPIGPDIRRVALEARILEAMGRKPAAQKLRWTGFEKTLNAELLREYIAKLDDFVEHEELERAFAHAARFPYPYLALELMVEWPRLDAAAALVLDRAARWDGRHFYLLAPAAQALEPDHPLAATVLYRALLHDLLVRARAQAYGHGTRYLAKLEELAARLPAGAAIEPHAAFVAGLRKAHARKAGFWGLVKAP